MFVHLPLVLMPLLALAAIAVAVRPAWRDRFAVVLGGAGIVLVVATWLAVSSGEAFDDLLDGQAPIERHEELARQSRLLAVAFVVFLLATVVIARLQPRRRPGTLARDLGAAAAHPPRSPALGGVGHACAAITVLLGVLATVWMLRTGHEGAKAVWDGTVQNDD